MGEDQYRVIYLDLPCSIKGFVTKKCDYYTIVLNSRFNLEQNKKTFLHELEHILRDDFNNFDSIDKIEKECHESPLSILLEIVK